MSLTLLLKKNAGFIRSWFRAKPIVWPVAVPDRQDSSSRAPGSAIHVSHSNFHGTWFHNPISLSCSGACGQTGPHSANCSSCARAHTGQGVDQKPLSSSLPRPIVKHSWMPVLIEQVCPSGRMKVLNGLMSMFSLQRSSQGTSRPAPTSLPLPLLSRSHMLAVLLHPTICV